MDDKIKSVLIGIAVGWVLSQLTDVIKRYLDKRKKIKAIYVELSDLSAWLDRMLQTTKHSMQLVLVEDRVTGIPAKLHTYLFDEYFHEVCIDLPRGARFGIVDAHATISHINKLIDHYTDLLDESTEITNIGILNKTEDIFVNATHAKFTIDFLLENRKGDLELLKGKALELEVQIKNELTDIKSEALSSTPEMIKEKYLKE